MQVLAWPNLYTIIFSQLAHIGPLIAQYAATQDCHMDPCRASRMAAKMPALAHIGNGLPLVDKRYELGLAHSYLKAIACKPSHVPIALAIVIGQLVLN